MLFRSSVFHPQIFTVEQIAEIPQYARDFGIRSFKFYMSGLPGVVESVSDATLLKGFRAVAALGPDAVVCVHCETGALIDQARRWDIMQYERRTRMDTIFGLPQEVIGHPDKVFDEQLARYRNYNISIAAVAAAHGVKAA